MLSELLPDAALGLLQWNRREEAMLPLVYVRKSGTLVWESACGSGTAAAACLDACRNAASRSFSLRQPGGVLTAEAVWAEGFPRRVFLQGTVRLEPEFPLKILP